VQPKRKRSLGRDAFERTSQKRVGSGTLGKVLAGRRAPVEAAAKEIEVRIKLTPSNLKQLDAIRARLESQGKGRFSRNDLIRVAIALLSAEDF
jgi:hypothetical protein